MMRRWLITGCSSGLGRALAEDLAASGEQVLATARQPQVLASLADRYPEMAIAKLDVRDPEQCEAAVLLAQQRFGSIDVLVNNAGYGQFGAVEEISDAELADQFATNFFGPWRLVREVLPLWRAQGSGHAIFVSSLAGSMALPGLAAYCASKSALEALASALTVDAGAFGVKSTALQLGGFATRYGESMREPEQTVDAYAEVGAGTLADVRALSENPDMTPPALFAKLVRKIVAMDQPPQRVPFGAGIEEYLGVEMTARYEEFAEALAAGKHQPQWVEG